MSDNGAKAATGRDKGISSDEFVKSIREAIQASERRILHAFCEIADSIEKHFAALDRSHASGSRGLVGEPDG